MCVRIVQRSKTKNCKNPISGHQWIEEKPAHIWDIKTRCGIVQTVKSHDEALKVLAEWQELENKFPAEIPRTEREINKAKRLGLGGF